MLTHPGMEIGDKVDAALAADGKTFFKGLGADGAFNVEQGVDAADRFEHQGRDHGGLLALRPGLVQADCSNSHGGWPTLLVDAFDSYHPLAL